MSPLTPHNRISGVMSEKENYIDKSLDAYFLCTYSHTSILARGFLLVKNTVSKFLIWL
jgi:hypothetical protein